jgi:hypothetical protein
MVATVTAEHGYIPRKMSLALLVDSLKIRVFQQP